MLIFVWKPRLPIQSESLLIRKTLIFNDIHTVFTGLKVGFLYKLLNLLIAKTGTPVIKPLRQLFLQKHHELTKTTILPHDDSPFS